MNTRASNDCRIRNAKTSGRGVADCRRGGRRSDLRCCRCGEFCQPWRFDDRSQRCRNRSDSSIRHRLPMAGSRPVDPAFIERLRRRSATFPPLPTPACPDGSRRPPTTTLWPRRGRFPRDLTGWRSLRSVRSTPARSTRRVPRRDLDDELRSRELTVSDVGPGRAESGGTGVYCVADGPYQPWT